MLTRRDLVEAFKGALFMFTFTVLPILAIGLMVTGAVALWRGLL